MAVHRAGTIVVAIALLAPAAGRAGPFVAGLSDTHPDDPAYRYAREVFDCVYRDTLSLSEQTPVLAVTDTTAGPSAVQTYACRPWLEDGPEHVYRLEVASRLEITARLVLSPATDLDLVLLQACDTDACLAQESTGFAAVLDPGAYVLIVEGYHQAAGGYTLLLEARQPGVPLAVCAEGGAIAIEVTDSQRIETGNLYGKPDWIRGYEGCAGSWYLGGETWYAVTLPPADGVYPRRATFRVSNTADTVDVALWIFDGCGESAACLAFADSETAGGDESLNLENTGDTPRLVYLAVDAVRPPATEPEGGFTLELQATVPVQRQRLGDIRAMFR